MRSVLWTGRAHATSPGWIVSDGFDAHFITQYATVYRVAYRIAGTRDDAEDLAQETFIRLHRSPQVWEGKAVNDPTVRGWLYRVATNLAYNAIRSRGRRQRREERTAVPENNPVDGSLDLAEHAATQEAVLRALARLGERQVQLLLLRQEGLSYRELAEVLLVAPGSVGTLLARAEAAFEKAYREVIG